MGNQSSFTIGIVGNGFVGGAVRAYFEEAKFPTLVNDKADVESTPIARIVNEADIVFVAVPTPMSENGACHHEIVEGVLGDIAKQAKALVRERAFVVVIKSTVEPGFTERMQQRHAGLRIVFSPEYLTEKNAARDFASATRIVGGGAAGDVGVLFMAYNHARRAPGEVEFISTSPTAAELAKLAGNAMLFTKVVLANEIFKLAQALGVNYEDVRRVFVLDPRIGPAHTQVPGHDGHMGAGGHCFPKDMANLRSLAERLSTEEKLFSAVLSRNVEVREYKDWEEMKGRAVV